MSCSCRRRFCTACAIERKRASQRVARRKFRRSPEGREDHRDAERDRRSARKDGRVGEKSSTNLTVGAQPAAHEDNARDDAAAEAGARRASEALAHREVLETSLEARRSLLGLTSLWVKPEPLRVALCADERGSWAWADGWTDALSVVGGYEVRFVVRGGGRGRR